MEQMELLKDGFFSGERALYGKKNLRVEDSVFDNGESPLKECSNIELSCCLFRWKYPLWYCKGVLAENCTWFDMARAGVWYSKDVVIKNTSIQAPKNFRRCDGIILENVTLHKAEETLWNCNNVKLNNVNVSQAPYFGMNSKNMEITDLVLDGNYSFDGSENITIRNSRLLTKDAFWNSKNVTVYDSFISGEYLGWNSENITLVNCTIESLQGMCYINGLKLVNCKLINTTLAFEYSEVEADIRGNIQSVFNPKSGTIKADTIGELIIEKDKTDPTKMIISCSEINKKSDKPEWLK